jgi:hypothetical protein
MTNHLHDLSVMKIGHLCDSETLLFVRAKDLQEAAQIQSEYVRTQFEAMQSQMREVGSAMQSTIQQATDQAAAAARSGTGQASGQADSPTTTRTRGKGA